MDYESKYLKYKSKYLKSLQKGGNDLLAKTIYNGTFSDMDIDLNIYKKIYLIIGYGGYNNSKNLELKGKIDGLIKYINQSIENNTIGIDSHILFMFFGDGISINNNEKDIIFNTDKTLSIADIICYVLFNLGNYNNIHFAFVNRHKWDYVEIADKEYQYHGNVVKSFLNLDIGSKQKLYIHYDFNDEKSKHMDPIIYGGIKITGNIISPLSNTYIWYLLYTKTENKKVWEMITIGGGNIAIGEYILAKTLNMKTTIINIDATFQNKPKLNHLNTYIANKIYLNANNTYEKIDDSISDAQVVQDITNDNLSEGKYIY